MNQSWKYGILEDAVNKGSSNISLKKIKGDDGVYPVFGAKGFVQNVSFYQQENEYLGIIKDGAGIGRVSKHPSKSSILATMQYILPKEGFDIQFIKYFLNYIDFEKYRTGSTIPHIYYKDYKSEPFPLVKIDEQKRIVAKLDECFEAIDKARANVEKNLQNAKELFLSNLQFAISGELTKTFREKLGHDYDSTVNNEMKFLISKIENTERKKNRRIEKSKGHEILLDIIPNEWNVLIIDSIFNIIDYRGKTPIKAESGKRLISAKNIKMGYISENPIEYVSDETYKKWMVRGFPKLGDIFFVTEGHTMGFTALNDRTDKFALAQRTITLQPVVSFSTQFFFYYMLSGYFQKIIKINATGAAATGIKASKFKSLILPFPSFAEQKRIVEKLDELKSQTQILESNYQQELDALDELKKSILQKAFNGEL